jgi:hypothetical protein
MPEAMKTNDEIQHEAQRMVELGRRYRDEVRTSSVNAEVVPLPRVLVRLPDSVVTPRPIAPGLPEPSQIRRERHVEAAIEHDELVFRLMARETETNGAGEVVRESPSELVMVSHSGIDLLHAGYELAEEDRLSEALSPYIERSEARDNDESADFEAVAKVEEILETNLLAPSDRLRAKAEIVEFLEGRLEASAFIAHAIDRLGAREHLGERVAQRPEMRLTINES